MIKENVTDTFSLKLNTANIELKNLKTFSSKFLTSYFTHKKIQIGFPEEFTCDYPETFYFYQGKDYGNYFLFTFLHVDEICCTSLYAATFSKATDSIISIAILAYQGGDGGWNGSQTANWCENNKIKTLEFSEYDNDLNELTINSEIDSIWCEISLSKKGVFKLKTLKKVSYLGNDLHLN